jgi:class 3 adenylate cyclase/pimeloyl-ACP methyl ester carboxylesterase
MHLDLAWTDPDLHHVFERGASYSRTVYFQHRGFGLSESLSYIPTLEQQAADVLAVMDAVGMRRATLIGILATSAPVALVAATAPERVNALVLVNPVSQGPECGGALQGWTKRELDDLVNGYRRVIDHWGSGGAVEMWDPMQASPYNRRLMALLERSGATPAAARAYFEWVLQQDIEDVLASVQAPTRVLRIPTSPIPEAASHRVAELIPHATFHLLPPTTRGSSMGKAWIPISDHVEEVATGTPRSVNADRYLGTVLFTDVVSSTELLERVGDAAYRQMRADHERLVRLAVENEGGRLMTVTGDGTLSVFDGPSAAVRAAEVISREADDAGLSVRAGIHTGELERDAMNVTGLTVHIGARVGAAAEPGQVLVSRTVRDLVAGSGLTFASRGEHQLKGVSGTWELFAVTHAGEQPEDLPREESMQTSMDKMVLQGARTAPAFVRAAVRLGNAIERRRARA